MESDFLFYLFICVVVIIRGYLWVLAVRDKGVKHADAFVTDMFIIMFAFCVSETIDLFNSSLKPYDLVLFFVVTTIVGIRNVLSLIRKFEKTRSLKNTFDQFFIVGLCTTLSLIIWFGLV